LTAAATPLAARLLPFNRIPSSRNPLARKYSRLNDRLVANSALPIARLSRGFGVVENLAANRAVADRPGREIWVRQEMHIEQDLPALVNGRVGAQTIMLPLRSLMDGWRKSDSSNEVKISPEVTKYLKLG
jgi:hypothetical protein